MNLIPIKYEFETGKEVLEKIRFEDLAFNFNFSKLLLNGKKRFIPFRFGGASFKASEEYQPNILSGVATPLYFEFAERVSTDIPILKHHSNNKFRCYCNGAYQLSVEWTVSITNPTVICNQDLELTIYKNGTYYKRLDLKPMFIAIDVLENKYFPFMSLQGTKEIDLTINDLFDIRLEHNSTLLFSNTVYHEGYIDIRYVKDKL